MCTRMKLEFRQATPDNAEIIGSLVVQLTQEICERTNAQHFSIDLEGTIRRCEELLSAGHYAAIIGWSDNIPVAVRQSLRLTLYMPAERLESFRSFLLFLSFVLLVSERC